MLKIFKKKKTYFFILILCGCGYYYYFNKQKPQVFNIKDVDVEKIVVADIKKVVTATGMLSASDTVNVGSQVSGIIKKIYVDYNSVVKKGDKLALIDTISLERELDSAKAQLNKAKARKKTVELDTKRTRELYKNNYISKSEMDNAENMLINATEDLKIYEAAYKNAKTQLEYAHINSPINGVVISKECDEGQTIAASFTTPILFKIAKDLKKMNIDTSISESDISLIKEKKEVKFTVDAYKNRDFTGKIKQVRYNPMLDQNVVVYNVVIEIENNDLSLLPGMTAYVEITILSVEDAVAIPNTALRFKADEDVRKALGMKELTKEEEKGLKTILKDRNKALIYVVRNNAVIPLIIEKGISDVNYTEVKSNNLKEGDLVISNFLKQIKKK